MGLCFGKDAGKKPVVTPAYIGTKAKAPPERVLVYGADAYELVRSRELLATKAKSFSHPLPPSDCPSVRCLTQAAYS